MHIKDISIKTRLIISNILMLIIPCSLVVIITAVIFTGFVYRFDGTDVRTQLTDSLGFISVYQLQFHVNQLEKEVLQTGENVSEQEEIVSMCKELEDTGALVAILFDNVPAYSTPGYTLEEWETEVEKIASGANFDEDSLLYTSSRGTILSTVTHAADGRRLCILICDPTLVSVVASTTEDLPKRAFEYMDTMGWVFIGLAILVTLATDIILVTFISRGILVPLDKLRRATHEIRDGNLDYRVDYEGKNELGDVCADFDEMRLRLRDSVKSQQRYEDNRKELLAGISHDLSTPLTAIKGYVSGLIDGIADTPEKQAHYLKTIYSTACDMDNLVSELFTFSKLDLDRIPFYFEQVDLVGFFEDCCDELQPKFATQETEIYFDNQCAPSAYSSVDRVQMKRAVMNIINNCVKYKKPGVCTIRITLRMEESDIRIEIADNGMGVSEEDLTKFLDRFYRTDRARTNVRSGSGLGLAITKQIIDRHSGKIWASGSIGKGLTICIQLPAVNPEPKQ